ncbi:MAG: hypothetical protein Q7T05_02845, partial [Dehalococcoidia bacterium]|nr:hypothetical protein [Dehalococcoidia bacterium]
VPHLKEEEQSLKKRIATLCEQEKRLVKLYSVGEIDDALIGQETKVLKTKRMSHEVRLKQLEQQRNKLASLGSAEAKATEVCREVKARLGNMLFEGKRLALRALKAQVWVFPDRIEVRGSIPIFLTIERTSA